MMLPILISVSVAPVSYFFSAIALLPATANKMTAIERATSRRVTKDISSLPWNQMNLSVVNESSNSLM
jgi:DNA-binding transcriptional regulator YdaS (Cro superfamily)